MNTAIQALPTYVQEKISTANVPILYSAAIKALAECRHIDDAKYFADKADALAAWAKIYKSDQASIESKRLKLHAFRRMGTIASEIRPNARGGHGGSTPGTRSLLLESGLSCQDAASVAAVTKLTKKKFRKAVDADVPRAPSFYTSTFRGNDGKHIQSKSWIRLHHRGGDSVGKMLHFCRKNDPKEIARDLTPSESKKVREMAIEIIEWWDTIDQYLR